MEEAIQNELGDKIIRSKEDLLNILSEIKSRPEIKNLKKHEWKLNEFAYCDAYNSSNYESLEVKHRSGIVTKILIPVGDLKLALIDVKMVLTEIYQSLGDVNVNKIKSVVDSVRMHVGQNYVYKVFLKGYYENTDRSRVSKRLRLKPFYFDKEAARIVTSICCVKVHDVEEHKDRYQVANGAPVSRLLAEIVRDTLDRRMNGVAKRFNLKYSRFRNEMIFSSKHNVYHENDEFIKELRRIISNQNFEIDDSKTCLQKRGMRQEVKGLIISNDKVNVKREYVRDVRSTLHILEKYGEEGADRRFKEKKNWKIVLKGKLDYIKEVKGDDDTVYQKLKSQYERLFNDCDSHCDTHCDMQKCDVQKMNEEINGNCI